MQRVRKERPFQNAFVPWGAIALASDLALLFLLGCARETGNDGGKETAASSPPGVAAFIEFFDSLRLQEPPGVVNVAPVVGVDPRGFLVIDVREGQGRIYDRRGDLVARFGRPGQGPGEYLNPMGAVRRRNGRIAVLEFQGRLTALSRDGDSVLGTARVPVGPPLYGLRTVGTDRLMVMGRTFGPNADLLHLMNDAGDSVVRSFFAAPGIEPVAPHLMPLTWMSAAKRRDTLFAAYGFVDSLYIFSSEGHRLGAVHVGIQGMPRVEDARQVRNTPAEVHSWLAQVRRISDVFALEEGTVLIQTTRVEDRDPHWGLVAVDPDGAILFDVPAAPRVLATVGDTVIMVSPGSDTPDKWTFGRMRR